MPADDDDGLAAYRAWERRQGTWAFHRREERRTSRRRHLDCGHVIDPRDLYVYTVGKAHGADRLHQAAECDYCQRAGNRY